ncbi:hypothetical protein SNE40_006182 [Patella caerulea]|uniref:Uncharacterized protein n=1 Tax=Patella caerulea TaxID=87958 RepID=A0AAN8Q464_PATCE
MGKTPAEYQREYRERKKRKDPAYLEGERKRQERYRKGINDLNIKDQKKRRDMSKLYSFTYREREKQKKATNTPKKPPEIEIVECRKTSNEQSPTISSSNDAFDFGSSPSNRRSSTSPNQLFVKLQFPNKKPTVRTNTLKKANNKIYQLREEIKKLKKAKRKYEKRCERMTKKNPQTVQSTIITQEEMTPKSKTKHELRQAGISPKRMKPSIVKKLIMSNAIINEVKETKRLNTEESKRRILYGVVSGKIIKKYRCMSIVEKEMTLSRKSLRRNNSKNLQLIPRKRMETVRTDLQQKVKAFMEREDISRMMPGKNDVINSDGTKYQKRILNDYLSNLYEKFKADHPYVEISFSTFCKFRPTYIHVTSVLSRNICLCHKHQSFAMKLQCLRSLGVKISPNPENIVKSVTEADMKNMLSEITKENIEYEEWQTVVESERKRLRVVRVRKTKVEFEEIMITEYSDFIKHTDRVKDQFKALRDLKENLPAGHVIIQMDFAENFVCQAVDEIQSAYFNSTGVTIHPVVAYHKDDKGIIQHKSLVFVSDVGQHKATAVLTIINKLIPELKKLFPDVNMVHYWTDSPSSQYGNRFIFDAVKRHEELFGVAARWNYFECGHGKGPCDGIGGTAKRQAAEAVKQGKTQIQDAHDFFSWAVQNQKSIQYIFYSQSEYDKMVESISSLKLKPVPGTMKLHAICNRDNILYTRTTSCYCGPCLVMADGMCEGWNAVALPNTKNLTVSASNLTIEECTNSTIVPSENDYVIAIYENLWYVGRVLKVDHNDKDVHVTFMYTTQTKDEDTKFRWPNPPDIIWVDFDDVVMIIDPPDPIGKSHRQFKIDKNTLDRILEKVDKRLSKT